MTLGDVRHSSLPKIDDSAEGDDVFMTGLHLNTQPDYLESQADPRENPDNDPAFT